MGRLKDNEEIERAIWWWS